MADRPRDPLVVERFARTAGVTRVARACGCEWVAPYCFIGLVWATGLVLQLITVRPELTVPWTSLMILELFGLLYVVFTSIHLSDKYVRVARQLTDYDAGEPLGDGIGTKVDGVLRWTDETIDVLTWRTEHEWIDRAAPVRLWIGFLAAGIVLHLMALFQFGIVGLTIEMGGLTYTVLWLGVVGPFVYYPVLAQFASVVATVNLALPARIRTLGRFQFEDRSRYGGLRPTGELIETSGYLYVIGLLTYTLLTIVRAIRRDAFSGATGLVAVDLLYVSIGIFLGAFAFAYPVYSLHRYIHHQKDARLESIHQTIREVDANGRSFPLAKPPTGYSSSILLVEFANMRVVEDIHEYPIRFQSFASVGTGLLLPLLVERGAVIVVG